MKHFIYHISVLSRTNFFLINTIFIKYFTDHFYIVKEIGLYGTRHNIVLVLYMYLPCLKL